MKWFRDIDRWFADAVLPNETALVKLARRLLGTNDAAQDLVQDVLTEVIADKKWQSIVNPRVYLMRMVYTRALNILKRRKVVPFQPLPSFETMYFADASPDAHRVIENKERVAQVLAAIDTLSPQCRHAFILCRLHELSAEEAGGVMGISASSVRSHLARGIGLLTQKLGSDLISDTPPPLDLRVPRADRD
jgi:RNA polymerase sigma-70 factor (ECF subfamily)